MGKDADHAKSKYKHPSANNAKEKYLTEYIVRDKKEKTRVGYNTTPNERNNNNIRETTLNHDYLINNLQYKCVCGNREVPKFQMKKVSFRNYTPKIINHEINMGMWV